MYMCVCIDVPLGLCVVGSSRVNEVYSIQNEHNLR